MLSKIFSPNNHLFDLARTSRRLPPVWLAVILAFIFIFGGQFIGVFPYLVLLSFGFNPVSPVGMAIYLLVFFTITLTPTGILLLLWILLLEKRPIRTLGLEKPGALKKFIRGMGVGAALLCLVVLFTAIPGYLSIQPQDSSWLALLLAVLITLPGWVIQSSLEEMVMRGWLLPVIGTRKPVWLAVLISSLLFAVLHLLNPDVSVLSTANIALAGLLFALVALQEGGIWAACGLHSAWNWFQGSVFGFAVSGNTFKTPALWKLTVQGPDFLTGGVFGPEGGLICTFVLVAACTVLGWLIYRKNEYTMSN